MECAKWLCDNLNMAPVKKDLRPLGRTFIAERREAAGVTQEQLAEMIDLSRSGLSKIETGSAPYTQRTLEAIAEALRCRPIDLLTLDDSPKKLVGEKQVKDMLKTIGGLPEDAIHPLWRMIRGFLEDAELQEQTGPRDQPEPANRRHATLPSR
jgi:transcriptional regulator with XRE-family HTH domain